MNASASYYVYIWHKPDGTPFYVGIGHTAIRWRPARSWRLRNKFCRATVKKYGVENILVHVFGVPSIYSAYRYERWLVSKIGRADTGAGTLTNITAGGDGAVAMGESAKAVLRAKWSVNTARKKALSAQSKSPENAARAAVRAADPNDPFGKNGPAQCAKINADPVLTAKRIAALRAASAKISAGVIAALPARAITMATPEVRAKMRRPKTAEHNKKNSDAKKLWWAKKKSMLLPNARVQNLRPPCLQTVV